MQYIVYFYVDQSVAIVPKKRIILGQYENLSLSDWENLNGTNFLLKYFC